MKRQYQPPVSMPIPATPSTRMPQPGNAAGFTSSIRQGWDRPRRHAQVVRGAAQAAAMHRLALSERFTGETLVIRSGAAPVRNNDSFYSFRPDSDFSWLTAATAEDAALVMRPLTGGGHDATLFIHPPATPADPGFYDDAQHGELWVGASPSLTDWAEALQIDVQDLMTIPDLAGVLHAGPTMGPAAEYETTPRLRRELSQLRMIKDTWELGQLREAAKLTVDGFAAVVAEIPEAMRCGGERWLQGTFDRYARTVGNGPGYATIVGSGSNAPVLHWAKSDGPVCDGDVLLLDMGVEMNSLYTADITRTVPVSGRFTSAQREVHDLVEKAHRAGLAQVVEGAQFSDFFVAIMEVIATGLHDWGLIDVSVDEALSPDGQQHRRYLACGVGHHLGLDLHDCAQATYTSYQDGVLQSGMVLTVEPGLYFHAHDLTIPAELRGIGVRLEDDVEVTSKGPRVLSDALPIDAEGIEVWTQSCMAGDDNRCPLSKPQKEVEYAHSANNRNSHEGEPEVFDAEPWIRRGPSAGILAPMSGPTPASGRVCDCEQSQW